MEAIEFVNNYPLYLSEINSVIKPELQPVLNEMKKIDPHDLVLPESYFINENQARGFVWSIFVKRAKKYNPTK